MLQVMRVFESTVGLHGALSSVGEECVPFATATR